MALFFCLCLSSSGAWADKDFGDFVVSKVWRVYDGDTITVDVVGLPPVVGHKIGIRLAGIDTAEMRGGNEKTKLMAEKAKAYVIKVLSEGSKVEIKNVERGKYFRLVGELFVDGRDIGQELLDQKLALPYDGGTKTSWISFVETL
jgi:endonuclease YncB( thermonuclease family)